MPMRVVKFAPWATVGAILLLTQPALGSQGGGGGGGMDAPSASAQSYDPAAEYQKGILALSNSDYKAALTAFRNVLSVRMPF